MGLPYWTIPTPTDAGVTSKKNTNAPQRSPIRRNTPARLHRTTTRRDLNAALVLNDEEIGRRGLTRDMYPPRASRDQIIARAPMTPLSLNEYFISDGLARIVPRGSRHNTDQQPVVGRTTANSDNPYEVAARLRDRERLRGIVDSLPHSHGARPRNYADEPLPPIPGRTGDAQRIAQPVHWNGLGDRERSVSPPEDDAWDNLMNDITPDEQLPSFDSSFTSAMASASASFGESRPARNHNSNSNSSSNSISDAHSSIRSTNSSSTELTAPMNERADSAYCPPDHDRMPGQSDLDAESDGSAQIVETAARSRRPESRPRPDSSVSVASHSRSRDHRRIRSSRARQQRGAADGNHEDLHHRNQQLVEAVAQIRRRALAAIRHLDEEAPRRDADSTVAETADYIARRSAVIADMARRLDQIRQNRTTPARHRNRLSIQPSAQEQGSQTQYDESREVLADFNSSESRSDRDQRRNGAEPRLLTGPSPREVSMFVDDYDSYFDTQIRFQRSESRDSDIGRYSPPRSIQVTTLSRGNDSPVHWTAPTLPSVASRGNRAPSANAENTENRAGTPPHNPYVWDGSAIQSDAAYFEAADRVWREYDREIAAEDVERQAQAFRQFQGVFEEQPPAQNLETPPSRTQHGSTPPPQGQDQSQSRSRPTGDPELESMRAILSRMSRSREFPEWWWESAGLTLRDAEEAREEAEARSAALAAATESNNPTDISADASANNNVDARADTSRH